MDTIATRVFDPSSPAHRESPSPAVESLILDLLEWVGPNPRPYTEVIEAWRTSCPRLPVWEEANDRGYVASSHEAGHGRMVTVSLAGRDHLRQHRLPSTDSGLPPV